VTCHDSLTWCPGHYATKQSFVTMYPRLRVVRVNALRGAGVGPVEIASQARNDCFMRTVIARSAFRDEAIAGRMLPRLRVVRVSALRGAGVGSVGIASQARNDCFMRTVIARSAFRDPAVSLTGDGRSRWVARPVYLPDLNISASRCYDAVMRTTLTLDADVLQAARSLARARSISLGAAVSELARRGIERDRLEARGALPHFHVPAGATAITLEDVKRVEDEA
jgi:hypothetical protein